MEFPTPEVPTAAGSQRDGAVAKKYLSLSKTASRSSSSRDKGLERPRERPGVVLA